MSFEQERGVYLGTPYLVMFAGFGLVVMLDLVLQQGTIGTLNDAEVLSIIIGLFGLMVGYIVNARYIRTGPPTTTDRNNLFRLGVMAFVMTTLVDSLLSGFLQYVQAVQDIGTVLVLAAAPFEEAFFRLTIASVLYRGIQATPLVSGFGERRVVGTVTSQDVVTMLATALITSWLFTIFHTAVYSVTDTLIMSILFVNSFIYTLVFIWTGDVMTSTTAHLLHNAAVLFL
jgi:membrane protease YdiL (CAAX protease family)